MPQAMTQGVAVSGMGVISAIGGNVPENLAALLAGRSGIGPITRTQTRLAGTVQVGEVGFDDAELAQRLSYQTPHPAARASARGHDGFRRLACRKCQKSHVLGVNPRVATSAVHGRAPVHQQHGALPGGPDRRPAKRHRPVPSWRIAFKVTKCDLEQTNDIS